MKQHSIFFAIALTFSASSQAEFVGPGSETLIKSVKTALTLSDDTNVTLEGNIVKQLNSEMYLFQDQTGQIEIEIDKEDFNNLTITPEDNIQIVGEIESEWNSVTIDVDSIVLIKS